MIENTSQRINAAVFNIIQESGLPAYLTEGIILGLLADVRERKAAELIMSIREENKKRKTPQQQQQRMHRQLQAQQIQRLPPQAQQQRQLIRLLPLAKRLQRE